MNFLQLCQRLAKAAGIHGTGPTDTVGQTNEFLRIVNWINESWVEIQSMRDDWNWMWCEFTFTTSESVKDYDPASTTVKNWDEKSFRLYATDTGTDDEGRLSYVPFEDYRDRYEIGAPTDNRPTHFTITPANKVRLWPAPDDTGYTIRGMYYSLPSEMTASTDTPSLPTEYHMAIVYNALVKYGGYEESGDQYNFSLRELDKLLNAMTRHQLPELRIGSCAIGEI